MGFKWIGAICVVLACGGFGFQIAANHRREVATIQELIRLLDFAECELQYRLTPLPELCKTLSENTRGVLKTLFLKLSAELEEQISPHVASCMNAAVKSTEALPRHTAEALIMLGESLGKFDLPGQIRGLDSVKDMCQRQLDALSQNQEVRLRSYKTLGLCAGAALAILFI